MAKDPYRYFRVEARELVTELAKGLRELDGGGDAEIVSRLLRHAHTLKGAARIVRHRALADLAHELETALAPRRDDPRNAAAPDAVAVGIVDRMTAELATLVAPTESPEATAVTAPATATREPPTIAEPPLSPGHDITAIDDALGGLAAVHARIARLRARGGSDAVELERIDRELVEVRRDVERLRLATAATLYTALERTARDAAAATGKQVEFELAGGDVRIDARVVAALHGAVVQLVRNAVVHGIEAPGARAAAGKPARGRVTVAATALGRRVVVACSDDGGGLDLPAIRSAATRRGVVAQGELGAAQLFALLLRGGISTSREVTELAGRGIGLDVVRDAVDRLGGEARVETGAAGTTVELIVPVSLASVAVVTADLGDRVVAIPRAAVRRTVRLAPGAVAVAGDGEVVYVDDTAVACARLATLLDAPAPLLPDRTMILVDDGNRAAAVTVARVLGVEDTVVRALPEAAPFDPIVWGLATDAEGQPVAVVDPRALVDAVGRARRAVAAPRPRPAPILVVDDSLTTRMLEQSILESAGFEVELAVSGEDALVKLERGRYALALVDVEMPGIDGFTLISTLRARADTAQLPAILVTSRDAPADRRRGDAVGANGYIVKGQFDQTALLALIRRLVA